MAIMIPSVMSPEIKSNAERKVFEWFQSAPGTDKWIVLHSLGIATHNKVIYGETDFLVLAPQLGVFALEVKGGRVKRENGIWYFTNRYGKTNSKVRGPFEQAKDGIFSIIEAMKGRVDAEHRHIVSNVLFGHGVMFPDINYDSSGIDEEQWQVFDSRDGMDVRHFINRLARGVKSKWESLYGPINKNKLPDASDVKYMASILRKDFDCAVPLNVQLRHASEELISLTKEQYRCLDQLDDNPRCLIHGPAGTGKTLLAIEEVKKFVARGEKVAMFCFNTNLADWLNDYFNDMPETLRPKYVGTFHKFMTQVAKDADLLPSYPNKQEDVQQYYQVNLPEAAILSLLEYGDLYDVIVIDEAQDLIKDSYLEVMSGCLKKGLSRGSWTMFGDFSMQAIYTDGIVGEQLIEKLEEITSFIRFKLTINCRNTKQICREIETITSFQPPNNLWTKVDGPPVNYITWSNMREQSKKLSLLLDKLLNQNIKPEAITILSPKKREDSVVSMIGNYVIKDFKVPIGKHIVFSTIQGYKGLENVVVIVTDIEDFDSDKLMYVALSRARTGLFILETDAAKKEYDGLLMRRILNER
ncbi:MAG: AAA family ATPase [Phascolarctobacterium sp.]|nr:AAA family ATPase [Phascolarctobacterium sp.]